MRLRHKLCPVAQIYFSAKYTVINLHYVTDEEFCLRETPDTQL